MLCVRDHGIRSPTTSETTYFLRKLASILLKQFARSAIAFAVGNNTMNDFIEVNGKQFNKSELSEDVLRHLSLIDVSKQNINDLNLQLQFLNKARDAYVAEVKAEINSSVSDFTFGDN